MCYTVWTEGITIMTNPAYILEDAGFTRDQINALTVYWDGSVATKEDIANLRSELKEDIAHLDGRIKDLRSELKEDIAHLDGKIETQGERLEGKIKDLRSELKEDIADLRGEMKELRTELRYIKWIGGAILVGVFIPLIKGFMG